MQIRADRRLAMRKNILSLLTILAVLAFFCQATWAGESFEKVYSDENVDAYKYHKTSLFGRDLAGVTIVGKQQQQPPILRLQYGSTTTTETTTTFSRCKERKEGRLTQAYFVGEDKKVIKQKGFQDAVNPAANQQPWRETVGGDGPSTGNLAVPAFLIGAGNGLGGWGAGQAGSVVNAVSNGGNMQQGQNTNNRLVGINSNANQLTANPVAISGSKSFSGANANVVNPPKGH
jgi:hypothetical protein